MKRREFIQVVGAAASACALSQTSIFSADYTNPKAPEETVAGMPRRLLGRTGLRVSEVALGAMTFGEDWGWGASREESAKIFTTFAEATISCAAGEVTLYLALHPFVSLSRSSSLPFFV